MGDYKILCENLEDFIATCAGLVREGINFTANSENLVIMPTGGY